MNYQTVIGLEIHVELKTKSKMFCSCPNDPDEKKPNTNVCPVCMGHPGTLPVINHDAVRKVIKTGLALNCQIPQFSQFDRKNYFYPDLPKGYQISQLYKPLCKEGFLEIDGKKIRIREVHLEEDTGRLIHEKDCSLVDFNRAGIPLMELATEPDLSSAKETRKFAEELHLIAHYLDVSDADMEKGQMRVEVNISLAKEKGKLGTKVEIKNLNSFRSVERAVEYEIERQKDILESGKKVVQETRGWDDIKSRTFSQREKEEAHDYRYFPEPDLPPLNISQVFINAVVQEMPELPWQKRERFKREYELEETLIGIFVRYKDLGEYFEKVISEFPPNIERGEIARLTELSANYLISDLQGLLKGKSVKDKSFLITPENFSELMGIIQKGQISSKIAKQVLLDMFQTGADPSHIIEEKNLVQIIDGAEIEKIIEEVISKNPKAVEDYKSGKGNTFQYLIGQVMAASKGRANPQVVAELLQVLLKKNK